MLRQDLISSSKYSIKCPYSMAPKGIAVHNTANDAPAKNEISYMKSNNNEVSFHIAVDDVEAIQGIPFDRNAWHAGDGGSGTGNRNYIAVEICYSKSGGHRFTKAEENAAKVIADICKQYGWGIGQVKKHQDFSGKYCPHRTLDQGWQRFLNLVSNYLNGSSTVTPPSTGTAGSYLVRVTADVLNVRTGPGTSYAVATTVKNGEVYTIVETSGNWGKLKSGAGWICLDYTVNHGSSTPAPSKTVKEGSRVKIVGTNYATGETVPSWVKSNVYTVGQVSGDKALLNDIYSWVYIRDLSVQ